MHISFNTILITLLLVCMSLTGAGALTSDTARNISASEWQQLTNDKDLGYARDIESEKAVKAEKPNFLAKFFYTVFAFFGSTFGEIILWGLVICVVGYIIFKAVTNSESFLFDRRKKKQTADTASEELEDITATNWDALLQKAVQQNNLKLAVRYSYMWLLQMLDKRQLIKYSDGKTNYEYYRELEPTLYKQPFKQLSRQYEYANYGNYELSAEAYNAYIDQFNSLRKQLGG